MHAMPPNTPRGSRKDPKKNTTWRNLLIIALIMTGLTFAFGEEVMTEPVERDEIPLTQLQKLYQEEQLITIEIKDEEAIAEVKDQEKQVFSIIPPKESLSNLGFDNPEINQSTEVKYVSTKSSIFWTELAARIIPFFLIILIFFWMMRSFSKGAGGPFSFGKSKDRMFQKGKKRTTFKDVAGCDESKKELEEIAEFLKNPKKFTKMGAKIPRGVLLVGPPGTGKTLLARAVAGEADAPFFSISGSEFVEMFVGVGASRVRDLFAKAKKNAPSIIFIDEIDAVGKQRGHGMGGGHDEREQTLNQILTEMDGFDNDTNVIIMAATNRPDVLDKALMRPGRFDRRVSIDLPQKEARKQILKVHSKGKPMAKNVDLEDIARITPGFSGAELANLLNEAAINAARENRKTISRKHIDEAHEKMILGVAKRSLILKPEEKENTAYHEAGHAIISHVMPHGNPVKKVTIIPRGMALGVTYHAPDEEQYANYSEKFFTDICVAMGGRAAEQKIFGDTTSGVSGDIHQATKTASNMVRRFGMSKLGPMEFGDHDFGPFGGSGGHSYSPDFAAKVDEEVQELLNNAYKHAQKLLDQYDSELHAVAQALLKKETLSQKEFEAFFPEKKVVKKVRAKKMKS